MASDTKKTMFVIFWAAVIKTKAKKKKKGKKQRKHLKTKQRQKKDNKNKKDNKIGNLSWTLLVARTWLATPTSLVKKVNSA